jgi:outer membrane protein OmpA-like peptidoglycan-associated protein
MKSKTMKIGIFLLLAATSFVNLANAQKGGKKANEKEILYQDFEKTKKEVVTEIGGIELAEGLLSSPTEIKADLFMTEAKGGDVGVPLNVYGSEAPNTDGGGQNYAGAIFYKPGKLAAERSYITVPIMKGTEQLTLKKGLKYCVEFSVSLAESSKFATNNISALFSKEVLGNASPGAIYNNSDKLIKTQNNKIYNGFFGWDKVCAVYTAKGDEKFITIGNFDKNETTKFEQVKKPKESEAEVVAHAYYYVDNVIIRLIDDVAECKCFDSRKPKVEETFSTMLYTNTPEISDKMTKNQIIESHTVYFRAGKASISDNAKNMMDFVIEEMKMDKALKIDIIGHNDKVEDKAGEENPDFEDMARKRANAVEKYFITAGIEETRLTKVYKGAAEPNEGIADDDDEETKDAKNRYVSFKVK